MKSDAIRHSAKSCTKLTNPNVDLVTAFAQSINFPDIHHLTAISSAIRENHRFYTQTLGMRLVKRTVNQDDVSAYHLFYADAKGSPGTDLTFFGWRGAARAPRHAQHCSHVSACEWERSAHVVVYAVLMKRRVQHSEIFERDGRLTLMFEDPGRAAARV